MEFQLIKDRMSERLKFAGKERVSLTETKVKADNLELVRERQFHFQTHFQGHMDIYSDSQTVAEYLDSHQDWFSRCAEPMKVEPLGNDGYTMTIGRFGSFGYEVEAKMGVVLKSLEQGVYLMATVPVPNYNPPGYEVDYQAEMSLLEIPTELTVSGINKKKWNSQLPSTITRVKWELHLGVAVKFPKFIYKFPSSLIQTTGDRLLTQIVRQMSPRLSYKVQKDFHSRYNLPLPPKSSRNCQKILCANNLVA